MARPRGQLLPTTTAKVLYSGVQTFNLTTSMATYSFAFTMNQPSDSDVKFELGLGAQGNNTVYLDNVAVR